MKADHQVEARVIHPEVIQELGVELAMELLKVGHDLRTGVIPAHEFDMRNFHTPLYDEDINPCGTAHCIAGWVSYRVGKHYHTLFYKGSFQGCISDGPAAQRPLPGFEGLRAYDPPLRILFYKHPSDPQMAADAIEQYVYNYAADPWKAAGWEGKGKSSLY